MMLKKRIISFLLVFSVFTMLPLHAEAISDEEVKAPAAILMEAKTGKVLYEKNPDEKRPAASITKVMTLLLVMEAIDSGTLSLEDTVTASAHAASMGGSDIWLKEGETMTVDDLIKATVIMSANDAAVALAEKVSGTEDDFVRRMNERAKELGMENTTFQNCNGLDEDGHLTTARDVAIMSAELIKHPKIFDYTQTWIDYVRDGKTQLVNTNKLLKTYQGITGLKTGTTGKAGSCITATAERDGLSLIGVVLGSSNTADRFSSATALLDYGFANWAMAEPEIPELPEIPVANAMRDTVTAEVSPSGELLVPKGKESEIVSEIQIDEAIEAPVEKGQTIGKVVYTLNGETVCEMEIHASESVERMTFSSVFELLLHSLISVE